MTEKLIYHTTCSRKFQSLTQGPHLEFSLPSGVHQERHPAVVLEVDRVDAALGRFHVDVLSHRVHVVVRRTGDGVEDRVPWLLILLLVLTLVAGDELDTLFIAVIWLKSPNSN